MMCNNRNDWYKQMGKTYKREKDPFGKQKREFSNGKDRQEDHREKLRRQQERDRKRHWQEKED